MAHELEHGEHEVSSPSPSEGNARSKGFLNRREYVQLGAVAVAVTLGAGDIVGASDGDTGVSNTYVTDFSEYSL